MGKYGKAAVIAARAVAKQPTMHPRDAWNSAVAQIFPDSESSRTKGCPRDSFLALCGMGAVIGVQKGSYTRSVKNRSYVERALTALRANPALQKDEARLWKIASQSATKIPNHQMDVVNALLASGLIADN